MRYLILCHECASEIDPDDIEGTFWAKYGDKGTGDEGAVLVCQDWHPLHVGDALQFFCDGEDCGQPVAVAPTSAWFIESHRREREEVE